VAESGLPPLWSGRRRRHLTLLILTGFGQAIAAGASALLFSRALSPSGAGSRALLFPVLMAAALTVGLLCMAERVLAEQLSQEYVREIRLGLIRRNLVDAKVRALGIAVARTTGDLTSVKNWVSQGVAPLAVDIPLTVGVGIVLMLLDPLLLVGLLVPLAVLVLAMRALAPLAEQRTRRARRQRGRLSSQVADTILSAAAIRSAGGSERELSRIEQNSQVLVAASIEGAWVAGAMRGAAAATLGITAVMVIGAGLLAGLPTHSIAGALTIVGFLAAPTHDLGRVVEYRQAYLTARRVIAPAIDLGGVAVLPRAELAAVPTGGAAGTVIAAFIELSDGTKMPQLATQSGARVVLDAGNDRLSSEVLERFAGLRPGHSGTILVGGRQLSVAGPKDLRRLVGYASQGMMLVRGTVSRTVRYRCPETDSGEVSRLLQAVGLADRVAELNQGAATVLVHGGEPLTIPERARLLLARAILGDPPLLVFDHLDADLGKDGRSTMRALLETYPGVVILASDKPEEIVTPTHLWRPDGVQRIRPTPTAGKGRRIAC
jgi:ABC-type multidrug transport system fused ATPase/permease subunit